MDATAHARYVRISPRKVRQVIDLIRGKGADEALAILKAAPKGASEVVGKVVRSAMANAEHNHEMKKKELYVAEAYVNQGPTLKRFQPRMRGVANRILKRVSHVTVVLRERGGK